MWTTVLEFSSVDRRGGRIRPRALTWRRKCLSLETTSLATKTPTRKSCSLATRTPSGQTAISQTHRRRCQHLFLPVAQQGLQRVQGGRGCVSKTAFLHCGICTAAGRRSRSIFAPPPRVLVVPASPRGPTTLLASTHQAPRSQEARSSFTLPRAFISGRLAAWRRGSKKVRQPSRVFNAFCTLFFDRIRSADALVA